MFSNSHDDYNSHDKLISWHSGSYVIIINLGKVSLKKWIWSLYVDKMGFQSLLSLGPSSLTMMAVMVVNSTIWVMYDPGKFLQGQLLAFLSWQSSSY